MDARILTKQESRQRIREIRDQWMWWDPIGISDFAGAADEYDGYLAPTLRLLERRASIGEIAAYLDFVAYEHMGLSSVLIPSREFAVRLEQWFTLRWSGTRVLGA